MKSNEKQQSTKTYKIYLHLIKAWVEVPEEVYRAYYRDIWATRKRAQSHGQCMCPKSKLWLCDGDCLACEFRAAGDRLSLDHTFENEKGKETSLIDTLVSDDASMDSILEEAELFRALHQRLEELDPDGRRICELIMEGKSEREAAADMQMARSTFKRRWNAVKAILREQLEDYC